MKLLLKNRLQCFLIATLCLLFSISSKASHIAGMDLTYKFISGTTYEITAVYYRDCAGNAAPTSVTVNIKSASAGVDRNITLSAISGTGQVISTPCSSLSTVCTGGTEPGIQKWVYRGTTTLGSYRSDWIFYTGLCCRNNAITTIVNNQTGGGGQAAGTSVTAKLNNLVAQTNSSPYFTNNPFAFICINQNFTFNHGVIDIDGDSLIYSFTQPQSDATGGSGLYPVTYLAPYSYTNPLSSSTPITLNSVTGNINMTPNLLQTTVMAVEIKEYRNGVVIGSVVRDMEMWVTNCGSNSLPVASGVNGTTNYSVVTCPGQQVCFNILTQDSNTNQNVTITWNNGIPAGTFTQTAGTRPTGTFCWTPTAADQGTNVFTVTVKDDACPSNGLQVFSYNVIVGGGTVTPLSANATCNGSKNGYINLTVNGGVTPYTYLWSNSNTTSSLNGLAAGTYSVVVTDGSGCTMTTSATITEPTAIITTPTVTNVVCSGASSGQVSLAVSGGTAPYTYLWSNSNTSSTANGLTAGTYTVAITDNTGCSKTLTATVASATPIIVNTTITNTTCAGGSNGQISLTVTGGTAPYSYLWSNSNTTNTATGLTAGVYTVTITDNAGCTATASATVTSPSPIVATATATNASCSGASNGAIALSVTGGTAPYSYLWSNNNTTNNLSGLTAGTYSVTVTDNVGCTATTNATINSPTALTVAITTATGNTTFCIGDSLALQASAGFTSYLWSTNATQQNIMAHTTGVYSVTATNSLGCTATASISVKDSICCLYKISKDSVDCKSNTFCVQLSTIAPVASGIIGMDYCLTYDPNIMTPTGNYTMGGVVTTNLSSPSGAQAQLNTNISGTVYSSIYYNSTVPAGTFWSGAGNVICIEFQLKPGVSQGTYALSACAVDEAYTLTTVSQCAKSGNVTINKQVNAQLVYWNFDQIHAAPARPIVYDAANPTSFDKTTISSGTVSTVPDMLGNFVWNYTVSTNVTIEKDITGKYGDLAPTCEDVFRHINGADAYLAALISSFDINNKKDSISNWIPNAFQMLASDVNMDDKVRASDITLIMSRSVRSICEYPQVWNYTQGTPQNPAPAIGNLSKDWRFFDNARLYDNTNPSYKKFQVDPAYPVFSAGNATNGYWRDNVPDVPFVLPIADTTNGNCPDNAMIYGVMLGDVDGFWNALDTATHSRQLKNMDAEMTYEVTNVSSVQLNKHRIAVYGQSNSTSVSFDFNMNYDESKIKNVHVSQAQNTDLQSQWNDLNNSNLYLTSYTLKGVKGNTGVLFYVDFETIGSTFDIADLGNILSLVNGQEVRSKVSYNENSLAPEFGTVTLYPNPSKGDVNYEIHVDGIKNVTVDITNVLGQIVYKNNFEVNETLRQSVNLLPTGKGVYFLRVTVGKEVNVSKIIIE